MQVILLLYLKFVYMYFSFDNMAIFLRVILLSYLEFIYMYFSLVIWLVFCELLTLLAFVYMSVIHMTLIQMYVSCRSW